MNGQSQYLQAIGAYNPYDPYGGSYGSYYSQLPEQLTYPNQAAMPYGPQFGQQDPQQPQPPAPLPAPSATKSKLGYLWSAASIAGTAVGAYHGYKRNNSIGWAIGWALLGGIFPIIVIPLAYAQGMGKRKGR